jgi:hypothetical protein
MSSKIFQFNGFSKAVCGKLRPYNPKEKEASPVSLLYMKAREAYDRDSKASLAASMKDDNKQKSMAKVAKK